MPAGAPGPGTPQHQGVDEAVVVVVCLNQVQPAVNPLESGFLRGVGEGPVGAVAEEPQLSARIPVGDEQVEVIVIVEVVGDHSSGKAEGVDPEPGGDVQQPREILFRPERLQRNQKIRGQRVRVLPEGHGGDVEQPSRLHQLP